MSSFDDRELLWLLAGVAALLLTATAAGQVLDRVVATPSGRETVDNVNARVRAWWVMSIAFAIAVASGGVGSVVLFAVISLLALREFVTLSPTGRIDHGALVWSFFLVTPLQYVLVGIHWYGFFSIMIPVYAFLFVTTRLVLAGETAHFLERAATIQWGLMTCVYCISYAPALLLLDLRPLDFMDSTGLRTILAADARAREAGRRLVVVQGNENIQRVFEVTRLHERVEIVDDPGDVETG